MKLTDLKKRVYRLAKVKTTEALKAQYEACSALDMRYKVSWEKALAQLQSLADGDDNNSRETKEEIKGVELVSNFEDWLNNPPDDYKELFADADTAMSTFEAKLSETKKLTKTALAMVDSLEEFAEASSAEAKQLAEAAQRAQTIAKQAE